MRFFDCNVVIGRWKRPTHGSYETAAELETVMEYLNVERSVVYHAQAQEGEASHWNAVLSEELEGRLCLSPSWIVFPHFTGEMLPPHDLVNTLLKNQVRVVRLLPGDEGHRFSLEPWCSGPLLDELENHRIPVLLDFLLPRRVDSNARLLYNLCPTVQNRLDLKGE